MIEDINDARPADAQIQDDGSLRVGIVVHEPWPSLRIRPMRSLGFQDEIIRASPGTPFWSYAATIPPEIRTLAWSLPSYPWPLLELCAANPNRGLYFLQNNPAFAVLIIRSYAPTKHGEFRAYLDAVMQRPWRQILSDLGLPARPRTMRLLAKVPRDHCNTQVVGELAGFIRNPGRWGHVLPHVSLITRDTIGLLNTNPRYVSPILLEAASNCIGDETPVTWTIASICSLRTDLDLLGPWPYGDVPRTS